MRLLIPILALTTVWGADATAFHRASETTPVAPPSSRLILPLEEAAPTDEIISGVEACRMALGDSGKFNPDVFTELRWGRGAAYPDGQRTEYYRRNLVNDILIQSKVDGCFTKARLGSLSQLDEIRSRLVEKYDLKNFDEYQGFPAERKSSFAATFGPKMLEIALFSNLFMLITEPTETPKASYVSITFAPINRPSQQ